MKSSATMLYVLMALLLAYNIQIVVTKTGCEFDGKLYRPGDHYGRCGECICSGTGQDICAAIDCTPVDPNEPKECEYDGELFPDGATFGRCNQCICVDGISKCSKVGCRRKIRGGKRGRFYN